MDTDSKIRILYYHSIFGQIGKFWAPNSFSFHSIISKLKVYSEQKPSKNDFLFIWNRHLNQDQIAKKFEEIGASVLLCENPYLLPHQITRNYLPWISIAKGYHNNKKFAFRCLDKGERFESFGHTIKPWKKINKVKTVLICTQSKVFDQRGLGFELSAQPIGWDTDTIKKCLFDASAPRVIFRTHPNANIQPSLNIHHPRFSLELGSSCSLKKSLEQNDVDLLVTHTSNSATEALLEGIPVCYTGPNIISSDCSAAGIDICNPKQTGNRQEFFNMLAWNQVSEKEIQTSVLKNILKENGYKL